jgi:carbamoyl-phosphate synthase large subunit
MSEPVINILFTSVGNPAFPTIVSELKKQTGYHFRIIGTDIRKEAPGLYLTDKSYLTSRLIDSNFIDEILTIIEEDKIDILFPLSTIDQNFFSANKALIEERGVKVVVSDADAVYVSNNKFNLYELLKQENVNPLKYAKIPEGELFSLIDEYEKPFVLKREEGAGGQGTYIVAETDAALREDDKKFYLSLQDLLSQPEQYVSGTTIITEYLPGDEFSVDTLSFEGKFYYAVIRKRTKSVGGLALESIVVENEEIEKLAEKIIKITGLSYINNLQFKVSQSGRYKMMEINPRVPGTIKLSLAAGADMIIDAIKLVKGQREFKKPDLVIGTAFFRYWDGAVATPGNMSALITLNVQHAQQP